MGNMIFNMKNFPEEVHRAAKVAAVKDAKTLKDWIIEAIKEKLEREKEKERQ